MAKKSKKSSPFSKIFSFFGCVGGLEHQSRIGEREIFIFPAFFLVYLFLFFNLTFLYLTYWESKIN